MVADSADVMQGLHHVASARGGEGGGGWSALEVAVIPAADAAGGGGVSDTLAALAGVVPPGSDYYPRIIDADDHRTHLHALPPRSQATHPWRIRIETWATDTRLVAWLPEVQT